MSDAAETPKQNMTPNVASDAVYEPLSSDDAFVPAPTTYRVYKRRFFGLGSLVLLNIVVSWSWLTFSAVSTTAAAYFDVSETSINWLSTGFLFAFVVACPLVLYTLNKYPPKVAIVISSVLVLVGSWLRYAGARAGGQHGNFPLVIFGHVIIGLAQPFVLASPTRYSDAWFSDKGRVSATAVASLANPLGGALGQLFGPLLSSSSPSTIPRLVLYVAIISSAASIPSFFLPSLPPTPPSSSTATRFPLPLRESLVSHLLPNPQFWLLSLPFAIYVGAFNATASLLNSLLSPYGFTEDQSGIAGALLIGIGLVFSACLSPIIDRTKAYLLTIKLLAPTLAASYLVLCFVPQTRSFSAVCVVAGVVGAASFGLLPCALEYLVEITHPVSPELSSVVAWSASQAVGGVMVIVMDALRGGVKGQPDGTMLRALIFQAVLAGTVLPAALMLGIGSGTSGRLKRTRGETG